MDCVFETHHYLRIYLRIYVEKNVFLSKYTTYKVGGIAKAIVYPKNEEKLVDLINLIKYYKIYFCNFAAN